MISKRRILNISEEQVQSEIFMLYAKSMELGCDLFFDLSRNIKTETYVESKTEIYNVSLRYRVLASAMKVLRSDLLPRA